MLNGCTISEQRHFKTSSYLPCLSPKQHCVTTLLVVVKCIAGTVGCRIFGADPSKVVSVLITCLTVLQQSRGNPLPDEAPLHSYWLSGYFEQENVNWKNKATGHPRGRVVKVFPVAFDLIARKMTRHILGRSL